MSLLRDSSDQLRSTFADMPIQSRAIAGMLVVAIAIGLGLLVRGTGNSKTDYLFGGRMLGEAEVDAVEIAFSQAGLNGWIREGNRIRIPSETRSEYLSALQDSAALPMTLRSSMEQAIADTSTFESNDQRMARVMHAKEQDLGRKIEQFPDIRTASVEYDLGERYGLTRSRPQSASVVVQPSGSSPISKAREQMIKELIKGSYAGMTVDDVVVIDTNGTSIGGNSDDDPLMRKRREAEAYFEQKIRSVLAGYGPIRVAAYAEIDPTMETKRTTLTYDEPTTIRSSQKTMESKTTRPNQGGVPGAGPNANVVSNRSTSIDTAEVASVDESERESNSVAGTQWEDSRMASLQVQRVRVSIGLPASYYEKVWIQKQLREQPDTPLAEIQPPAEADLQALKDETQQDIQTGVVQLLPPVAGGQDAMPLVTVFDYPDLPDPPAPESETAKIAMAWLANHWQSIALIALAFFALIVALSAAKKGGQGAPRDFSEGFGLELPKPPPEEAEPDDEAETMTITGGTLKDELVELVEANPEVAANVIRGWIGEAA
tara:strand:- start:24050 stop:25684 length:1635 start_codon:yes stop_codon:yes gene_type:complete